MFDLSEVDELVFLIDELDYAECIDIAVKGTVNGKPIKEIFVRVNIKDIPKLQEALKIS